MNAPTDRDDEFESAVRARRRLVPRFDDADDAEPSPELDRIVLARARDAVRAGTVPTRFDPQERHYRGPRWAVPLALVATVLLSFTLVMQLDPARNDTVLAPRDAMPAAAVTEAANDRAAAAVADESVPARPQIDAPDERAAAVLDAAPPAARAAAASDAPAPAQSSTAIAEVTERAAPPAGEPDALAAARRDAAPRARAAAPMTKAASPPPPAPPMADPGTSAETYASAEASAPAAAAEDATAQRAATAGIARDDPAAWLARIERLRRAGEIEAARTELAAFEQRFPDHPLPAVLEALRGAATR
jgi:hypothetical protein